MNLESSTPMQDGMQISYGCSKILSVPWRPGTPAYKFQIKTEGETCKSHTPACDFPRCEPHGPGQLRGRHVSRSLSSRCPAQGSSGAATCPAASAPAARPGAAPGPPRVLRPQLPLPSPGQLRGRHVCPGGPTVDVLLK
jgi:hypothetical protein